MRQKSAPASKSSGYDPKPVQVNYVGDSYCTKNNKCKVGEGDCDRDSDCQSGLKCGQRNNREGLPGLFGFEKFEGKNGKDKEGDGDYCYDPNYYQNAAEADPDFFDLTLVQVVYIGDNPKTKMSIGEGDCDRDSDCKSGLKCGQRGAFEGLPGLTGWEKVEGKNGKDKAGDGDYCYDPDYMKKANAVREAKIKLGRFDEKPIQVVYAGDSFCTSSNKCDLGYGDCDSDSQCMTGLKCG